VATAYTRGCSANQAPAARTSAASSAIQIERRRCCRCTGASERSILSLAMSACDGCVMTPPCECGWGVAGNDAEAAF
jgi:hypothetical protein